MVEDGHSSAARRASMRRESMGRARDPHLGWRTAVLSPLILYLLAAGVQYGAEDAAALAGDTTPFWSFGAEAAALSSAPGVAEEELALQDALAASNFEEMRRIHALPPIQGGCVPGAAPPPDGCCIALLEPIGGYQGDPLAVPRVRASAARVTFEARGAACVSEVEGEEGELREGRRLRVVLDGVEEADTGARRVTIAPRDLASGSHSVRASVWVPGRRESGLSVWRRRERIFVELVTSDRKLKTSREGSK